MISIRWLYLHLLTTGIVLLAWLGPVCAGSLKDIRIGEYDDFTRIVFEADTELAAEEIISSAPGRLTVVFSETRPEFIRKIPVERSPHIDRIEVLSRNVRLSVTLHFSNRHARFDTFWLKSPPRMALDIFWPTGAGTPGPEPAHTNPLDIPAGGEPEKTPLSSQPESAADGEAGAPERLAAADVPGIDKAEPSPRMPHVRLSERASPPPGKAVGNAPATGNEKTISRSLQYYLVIALVVITISILVILVFMLLFRHQWGEERRSLKPNESLQYQDKRIASINARVQEQLKRYDEV